MLGLLFLNETGNCLKFFVVIGKAPALEVAQTACEAKVNLV